LALARYYEEIGEQMLPHVRGRPLSLLRWQSGERSEKGGLFLRHARAWGPSELRRIRIQEKTKIGEYLVVDSVAALVALAQMDILEIHTWNSIAEDLERPNRIVLDLDPADVAWPDVVAAAHEIRDRLLKYRLMSWVKTTGGKGLHVVVPLVPSAGWDDCLAFTRDFARKLAADAPTRYLATMAKSARKGRIFIDYLRNNRTSTAVAAYSIRARAGAPVSVPLDWDELDPRAPAPPVFSMTSAIRRFAGGGDPWKGYWRRKQRLPLFGE
jgi:bifunctional non-homologous end joining protein LigD